MRRGRRTVGSLTHDDFGSLIEVEGYPEGKLWAVHHVNTPDGSAEPYTCLTLTMTTGDIRTRGLAPSAPVAIHTESRLAA